MTDPFDIFTTVLDFIKSPFGQIVLWGTVTFITFIYTVFIALENSYEREFDGWRIVAAGLISVLWTINVSLWFAATMHWMLFSDLFFVVISYWIFKVSHKKWALYLTELYAISYVLDLAYWNGVPQTYYAWSSNVVYVFQLFTVSGWRPWSVRGHNKIITR